MTFCVMRYFSFYIPTLLKNGYSDINGKNLKNEGSYLMGLYFASGLRK